MPTPIAPGLRFESSGWGPDPGPLSSAILEMPRNPRTWVLGLFAILAQSCELWIDCRFKVILTQFRRNATNCHQSTQDCPSISIKQKSDWNRPRRNRQTICQKSQDANSDRNLHNHIELRRDCKTAMNCQGIARIASKSWQIHKLQANVPNCPRICIRLQSVRSRNAIPKNPGNAGTIFRNPGDCGGMGSQALCNPGTIAWIVDRPRIAPPSRPDCNPPKRDRGTIDPQDANPDRNFHNRMEIAKPQRIARGLKGLQQNPG